MKYRLIESRVNGGQWEKVEVVYEDPELGVTRFRPRSRHAFRVYQGPIETVEVDVARESGIPGVTEEFRISPVYDYSGRFDPLEPDILFEEVPVLVQPKT